MKTNQIPDIYIEQYLLGELPENLRLEMESLIAENPELKLRIDAAVKSNEEILAAYPAEIMTAEIAAKIDKQNSIICPKKDTVKHNERKNFLSGIIDSLKELLSLPQNILSGRHTLSIASAAITLGVIIFFIPGIIIDRTDIPYNEVTRIKGLESKLLLYRMKGKDVEELRNYDTARRGDIIQAGYIAAGDFTYGIIFSLDGRGAVTLHFPDNMAASQNIILNKKVLLSQSYELDDSPSFERFFMILSNNPIDTEEIFKNAKKLANNRDSGENGTLKLEKDSVEYSIIIKKTE